MASRRAAVLLLATVAAVSACGSETTSPSLSPSSGAPRTSSLPSASVRLPTPTATPGVTLTWTAEPFGGAIHGLRNDRGALVAAGRDADGLASWTSPDGASWQRHDVPDPTFIAEFVDDFGPGLYEGTSMGPMTRLGSALFSFGGFVGPIDFYRPVAWLSEDDGASWEFIESGSEFYDYGATPVVFAYHDGLVAVLQRGHFVADHSVWQWSGQTSWQERELRRPPDTVIASLDVALSGEELILAVGGVVPEPDAAPDPLAPHMIAWRTFSADRWQRATLPEDVSLPAVIAAAPAGGFVMIASDTGGVASGWFTPDGLAWSPVELAPCGEETCDDFAIASAGDWLVATGSDSGDSRVWVSQDGFAWTEQVIPNVRLADPQVTQLGQELFIVGTRGPTNAPETVLLRGSP